jgi:hypothetical protein
MEELKMLGGLKFREADPHDEDITLAGAAAERDPVWFEPPDTNAVVFWRIDACCYDS